jgi:hypothetical protein
MALLATAPVRAVDAPAPAGSPAAAAARPPGPTEPEKILAASVSPPSMTATSANEAGTVRPKSAEKPAAAWLTVAGIGIGWSFVPVTLAVVIALWLGWRRGLRAYRKAVLWFDAKALGVRRILPIEEVDQSAVLTPTAVHERGWSVDLMERILGAPDYAVVDPTGRFPPIILLSKERVERIEKSKQFQEYIATRTHQASVTAAQVSKWVALKEECLG